MLFFQAGPLFMILSLIYTVIVGYGSIPLLFYDTLGMVHVISCLMVSLIQTLLLLIAVLLYKQEYLLPKTHDKFFYHWRCSADCDGYPWNIYHVHHLFVLLPRWTSGACRCS